MNGSVISSIGTATPPYRVKQSEILNFMVEAHQLNANDASRLKKLYDFSGIDYRHSVIPDFTKANGDFTFFGNQGNLDPFPDTTLRSTVFEENALNVSLKAVDDLFEQLKGIRIADITHLITVSCTGMYAPGLDIDLIEKLGMSSTVERTCINFMGCYGAFNALKTADYICRADGEAKVLIVDVELCTLHFQRESTLDNWIANSIFSDGAAAVLVESGENRSTAKGFEMKSFYNLLVSGGKEDMSWRIGNTGFQMQISSQIAKKIRGKIKEVATALTSKAKSGLEQVSNFAIHPGGRRILEVCEEVLDLQEDILDSSYETLKNYGNMSSCTILFVLKRLMNRTQSGESIVSFAFGPGLTFESMYLKVK